MVVRHEDLFARIRQIGQGSWAGEPYGCQADLIVFSRILAGNFVTRVTKPLGVDVPSAYSSSSLLCFGLLSQMVGFSEYSNVVNRAPFEG